MHQALQHQIDEPSPNTATCSMGNRSKLAIGGMAALSAMAIAVMPATPSTPALLDAKQRSMAVDLVASSYIPNPVVTDSPENVYGTIFEITSNNLSGLGDAVTANPLPLLSQIAENQEGYLERITKAFQTVQGNSDGFFAEGTEAEGKDRFDDDGYVIKRNLIGAGNGYVYGTNMLKALEKGDIFRAYEEFNAMALYSNTVASTQIAGLLLDQNVTTKYYTHAVTGEMTTSATAKDADGEDILGEDGKPLPNKVLIDESTGKQLEVTTVNRGIPGQMVDNLATVFSTIANRATVQSGIFYSAWSAFGGVPYELARSVDELVKAVDNQDFETAFNVVVNTPGMLGNALLNGFDYAPDDLGGNATQTKYPIPSWPGLLAPLGPTNPNNGNPLHPGGLIYQAVTGLPSSIADAIDNTPDEDEKEDGEDKAGARIASAEGQTSQLSIASTKENKSLLAKESESTTATSKAAERAAKLKASADKFNDRVEQRVEKINNRIESTVKKVEDGLRKLTVGQHKSAKGESSTTDTKSSDSTGGEKKDSTGGGDK